MSDWSSIIIKCINIFSRPINKVQATIVILIVVHETLFVYNSWDGGEWVIASEIVRCSTVIVKDEGLVEYHRAWEIIVDYFLCTHNEVRLVLVFNLKSTQIKLKLIKLEVRRWC